MKGKSSRVLREIKVKFDGSKMTSFDLELLHRDEECVVGKWTATSEDSFGLDRGSYSYGVWFFDECWTAYRIHRPCGGLVKYRFDACEKPEFNDEDNVPEIRFRDLILDVAIFREKEDLRIRFEDRDEVEMYMNLLDRTQIELINCFSDLFENRPSHPVEMVDDAIGRCS